MDFTTHPKEWIDQIHNRLFAQELGEGKWMIKYGAIPFEKYAPHVEDAEVVFYMGVWVSDRIVCCKETSVSEFIGIKEMFNGLLVGTQFFELVISIMTLMKMVLWQQQTLLSSLWTL